MEPFAKIVTGLLTKISRQGSISDVWLGSKCISGRDNNSIQGYYLDDQNFEIKVDTYKKISFADA